MSDVTQLKKRKRSKKKLNKITFDDEITPKNLATKFNITDTHKNFVNKNINIESKQHNILGKNPSSNDSICTNVEGKQKRKRKKNKEIKTDSKLVDHCEPDEQHLVEEETLDPTNPKIAKEESKRAKKRKKHEELILEKKLKVDVVMQEKCLNYLSKWKHNRNHWKFEKLRQIWLYQNMFDDDKIPNQFWETLVEYFSSAKGKIRQAILDDALKIIENAEHSTNHNDDEVKKEDNVVNGEHKIQRAKSIIQSLQDILKVNVQHQLLNPASNKNESIIPRNGLQSETVLLSEPDVFYTRAKTATRGEVQQKKY